MLECSTRIPVGSWAAACFGCSLQCLIFWFRWDLVCFTTFPLQRTSRPQFSSVAGTYVLSQSLKFQSLKTCAVRYIQNWRLIIPYGSALESVLLKLYFFQSWLGTDVTRGGLLWYNEGLLHCGGRSGTGEITNLCYLFNPKKYFVMSSVHSAHLFFVRKLDVAYEQAVL